MALHQLSVGRAVLPEGSVIHVRPIAPDDKGLLRSAFERLGPTSRYRRFLHSVKRLSEQELVYLTDVDHRDHEALIALDPASGELVGVARYIRAANTDAAEVAIAVIDDWQGRGVGTVLLHELVERARASGLRRFTATCLADNLAVIDLLQRLGPTRIDHPEPGLAQLSIKLPDDVLPDGELYTALRYMAAGRIEAEPSRLRP